MSFDGTRLSYCASSCVSFATAGGVRKTAKIRFVVLILHHDTRIEAVRKKNERVSGDATKTNLSSQSISSTHRSSNSDLRSTAILRSDKLVSKR